MGVKSDPDHRLINYFVTVAETASDFISSVMSKKQRIDQQPSYVQPAAGGHSSSWVLALTSHSTSYLFPVLAPFPPAPFRFKKETNFKVPESQHSCAEDY